MKRNAEKNTSKEGRRKKKFWFGRENHALLLRIGLPGERELRDFYNPASLSLPSWEVLASEKKRKEKDKGKFVFTGETLEALAVTEHKISIIDGHHGLSMSSSSSFSLSVMVFLALLWVEKI